MVLKMAHFRKSTGPRWVNQNSNQPVTHMVVTSDSLTATGLRLYSSLSTAWILWMRQVTLPNVDPLNYKWKPPFGCSDIHSFPIMVNSSVATGYIFNHAYGLYASDDKSKQKKISCILNKFLCVKFYNAFDLWFWSFNPHFLMQITYLI